VRFCLTQGCNTSAPRGVSQDGVAWRGPVDRSIVATVGSVVCGRVDIRI
jgi:hypothetical protein